MQPFSWESLVREVERFWDDVQASLPEGLFSRETATEVVRLTRPVEPFNSLDFLAPILGLAGALLGVLLAGVALASLGTLLTSLLALGFLLTEVYGVTLEMDGFVPPT